MNEYVYYLIVIVISYIFNVFIHELGHYIFGMLTGYKLIEFKVMFLCIYRDGIKFCPDFKSYCTMYNKKENAYILYNLGGIIINLISLLVVIFLYNYYPSRILVLNIGVIVWSLLTNILPYKYTDIYITLYLLKNLEYRADYFEYLYTLDAVTYSQPIIYNYSGNKNIFTAAIREMIEKD